MSETSKAFIVCTIARQIDGEYLFIKTEKGYRQESQALELLNQLKRKFVTLEGKIMPIKVSTPNGDAECFCEVGVFEVEIE